VSKTVIVVLGHANDKHGRLTSIAQSRCHQAKALFELNSALKILCTGGVAESFNPTHTPNGEYAQVYLQQLGVPIDAFLSVAPSKFTLEDATLSEPILKAYAAEAIYLVTSDFHMPRAELIFAKVFPNIDLHCYPSTTELPKAESARLAAHELLAIERDKKSLGTTYFKPN